jgi:hypothetical protein
MVACPLGGLTFLASKTSNRPNTSEHMIRGGELTPDVLAQRLTYAGFVLVAYELVKSMIVGPIKMFYADTTFGEGMPFTTYAEDVRARHENEFEACLLYLSDFMEALDANDVSTIQSLRKHRNDLAHNLAGMLSTIDFGESQSLWDEVDRTIFKLSNYRAYIEIGADPEFRGIDWAGAKGGEYLLFEQVVGSVKLLNEQFDASK